MHDWISFIDPCVVCWQSVDSAFLQYLIGKTIAKSASVHLLFAFEYIIQVCGSPSATFSFHPY